MKRVRIFAIMWFFCDAHIARGMDASAGRSLGLDAALWLAVYGMEELWIQPEGQRHFATSGFDEYAREKLHGNYATRDYNLREMVWRNYSDYGISTMVVGAIAAPFADSSSSSTDLLAVSRVFAANNFATTILKNAFHRSRPKPTRFDDVSQSGDDAKSFPSGHASNAFAAATTIVTLVPSMPIAGQIATYGFAGSIAIARLMADRHFATDILVGALLGHAIARSTLSISDDQRLKILPGLPAFGLKYSF